MQTADGIEHVEGMALYLPVRGDEEESPRIGEYADTHVTKQGLVSAVAKRDGHRFSSRMYLREFYADRAAAKQALVDELLGQIADIQDIIESLE